jgi:hypothetical protein
VGYFLALDRRSVSICNTFGAAREGVGGGSEGPRRAEACSPTLLGGEGGGVADVESRHLPVGGEGRPLDPNSVPISSEDRVLILTRIPK